MPDEPRRPAPHRTRGFLIFVLILIAANWLSVLAVRPGIQPRVQVPFNPYFLQHVQAGQVASIASARSR